MAVSIWVYRLANQVLKSAQLTSDSPGCLPSTAARCWPSDSPAKLANPSPDLIAASLPQQFHPLARTKQQYNETALSPANSDLALVSIRMMHLLERIAAEFNSADVPLMALKGGGLNLLIYDQPGMRPMADLDLMIHQADVETACTLLEELSGLKGEPQVREDFFPRFHYELEYSIGVIHPVKIDLHVRPFRPLRYARLIPPDAFWRHAKEVSIGDATILVPSIEENLIHLAVHSAVHGNRRMIWLEDILLWAEAFAADLNWDRLIDTAANWGVTLPIHRALLAVQERLGMIWPAHVMERLQNRHIGWRDRLTLWHAPRDAHHRLSAVAVNALCTPGLGYVLAYLWRIVVPDRRHMRDWYSRDHWGWLPVAHGLRLSWPILRMFQPLWSRFCRVTVKQSGVHGLGVFTTRDIREGQQICRYHGRKVDRDGLYVMRDEQENGQVKRYELTGPMRFLNHSCLPNAKIDGFNLIALRDIPAGQEITISYGGQCTCQSGRIGQ